ncbi:hypothetical protein [Nocardia thailandica]|uniref:Uncharacterized protein n=1 Tax=Nocardia thailandica TaxID=257275 RepID=A0ABW6PHL1_9NOCA
MVVIAALVGGSAGAGHAAADAEVGPVLGPLGTASSMIGSTAFDTIDANLQYLLRCALFPGSGGSAGCGQ